MERGDADRAVRGMKKPSLALFERQARLARYRHRERFLRAGRRRVPPENRYVVPGERIQAPVKFDAFRASGTLVAKFLRAVARAVLELQVPVVLDFRRTESFYPVSTIYLFAELDRIVFLSDLPKPVTIIDPRLRRPREVLKQIGVHAITGDSCDVVPERDDVVYWRATKGRDQSGTNLQILEVVAENVNKKHAESLELSGLWRGVSEAVGNSVEHAHKFPRSDGFHGLPDTKWWMFTQLRDNVFTVAVCDLGCGYRATINQTLPEKFIAEAAARFAGGNRDAIAIQTAMAYGRSGTAKTERGKGSRDALSVLQKLGHGDLMILSNTGWVQYSSAASGKAADVTSGSVPIDIRGTIIWWKLPVGGQS